MSDIDRMQERLAHLEHSLDELSDTVARQDREIETLQRRLSLLMSREAEREAEATGGTILGDERPPHY